MCRILSISGKIEYRETAEILQKFQRLAEYGKIARGSGRGHKDGWGIAAYKKGKPFLFTKSYENAFKDPKYLKVCEKLENKSADIVISHLRKASVSKKNINNAHPFVEKKYIFCQNGTIFESNKIPLEAKFKKLLNGETDSEKFFAFILQFLSSAKKQDLVVVRGAISKAINYIRENFDFTAINMIFSDGNYIWALREANVKNKFVRAKKLISYYSLFLGVGGKYNVISSEKLDVKNVKWKAIKNHEMVEINSRNQRFKLYQI